ncbi:hypothetical protein C2E23DRAFT_739956, partial [Lenzites betulinus]
WLISMLRRRLHRFLDYTSTTNNIYYISQLPRDRLWRSIRDTSYLCSPESPGPLRVWAVGSLSKLDVNINCLHRHSRFTINLSFVRDIDRSSAQQLHTFNHSLPRHCTHVILPTFDAIFDATYRYGPFHTMPRLPPTDLVLDDILLVEFFCRRERRQVFVNNILVYRWICIFELDALSLLVRAPRGKTVLNDSGFTGTL